MPKREKRTEQEVHAMIISDAKIRLGCPDFAPDCTINQTRDQLANWDVRGVDPAGWAPDCTQAFKEAVARARRKFDIAWL